MNKQKVAKLGMIMTVFRAGGPGWSAGGSLDQTSITLGWTEGEVLNAGLVPIFMPGVVVVNVVLFSFVLQHSELQAGRTTSDKMHSGCLD